MFYDHNLTVTAVAEAATYGRTRRAIRGRIARQNVAARKDRMGRTLAVFVPSDEHAGLMARGRALLERAPADHVASINVGSALSLLERAERSWKRPGSVVVMVNHADAVLLGNVFRRLNGFGLGLARLDEIAVRQAPAGTPFDVFTHELITALEALDAAGEARAAALLRTATAGSTTWRIHVAPADAGWLLDSLRAVGAPHRFLAALAPIAAAVEGNAS